MEMSITACIFLVALPLAMSEICPDSSSCPGEEKCCSSTNGYRCCPLIGGSCCPDGLYCCPPGYNCIPWLDICILAPLAKRLANSESKRSSLPQEKTAPARIGQCPPGTTWCAGGIFGDLCCPLPAAVCCSDQMHCCPRGYTCDLEKEQCIKNTTYSPQFLPISLRDVKVIHCPDDTVCPDDNTCCAKNGGSYRCCEYPLAVCCSDHTFCCPHGTTCDITNKKCVIGFNVIPWLKKVPAMGEYFNNSMH